MDTRPEHGQMVETYSFCDLNTLWGGHTMPAKEILRRGEERDDDETSAPSPLRGPINFSRREPLKRARPWVRKFSAPFAKRTPAPKAAGVVHE
jgi:hypothetical protein